MLQQFYGRVCTPAEAPEKVDHGDLDILVDRRLFEFSRADLAEALGAKDHLTNGPTSSFAVPLPASDTELFQLDIHSCKPGFFEWESMIYTHGDLWLILGTCANRVGFSINSTGLHLRVAEIEITSSKDSLLQLTSDPKEMMNFLSLDADRFASGFTSVHDLFNWATTSRVFQRRYFEKQSSTSQGKKMERPMYLEFKTKWLPQHPDVGAGPEGNSPNYRETLTEEALRRFDKQEDYAKMIEDHRKRLMRNMMWRRIAKALPLEGKELGEAMKALKALLRWRAGAPELNTEEHDGDLPALEESIVDAVVLPWISEHWQEAVVQHGKQ
ncbi:MAG: hypothetical protein Q9172_001154 [Xanthocarpia lactea]